MAAGDLIREALADAQRTQVEFCLPPHLRSPEYEWLLTEREKEILKQWEAREALRDAVYARFGYRPERLDEAEMRSFLDSPLDPYEGKWYLFLKDKACKLDVDGLTQRQSEDALEARVREYMAETYRSTPLPLDMLWDICQLALAPQTIEYVLRAAEAEKPPAKNFPLGKTYAKVPVTGLRKRMDPVKAAQLLVCGLVSDRADILGAVYQAFDREHMEKARQYVRQSNSSPGKLYYRFRSNLGRLTSGDETAARHVLDDLRTHLPAEAVSDLVAGVEGLFGNVENFSYLHMRMQDGVYKDLFDNRRLMACPFLPSGEGRGGSLIYYDDPDVGLLHAVPETAGTPLDPVGVAILVNAHDAVGEKWLVVDSVEGGKELDRIRDSVWIPPMYESILRAGRDVAAEYVMFNRSVFGGRPKTMNAYVKKRHPRARASVYLSKAGSHDFSRFGLPEHAIRYAFESWDGHVEGKAIAGYAVALWQ